LLAFHTDGSDDLAFVRLVYSLVEGAVAVHQPAEFHVTKVDHWFGHKWLAFSGKVVGAVGSWRKELTIPPFVQNRIVEQCRFKRVEDSKEYLRAESAPDIHHQGCSEQNLRRSARDVAPNAALFWYSGDTKVTGGGGLMGYIPIEEDYWTWYLGFKRDEDWRIWRRKGIHEYEVQMLHDRGLVDATEKCGQVDRGYW
jgi:hypothetical protein